MPWQALFSRRRSSRQIDALAARVAERCLAAAVSLVAGRTGGMSRHEAQGYIRARTAGLVAQTTDRVLTAEGAITASSRDRVQALATAMVIEHAAAAAQQPREIARPRRQAG